MWTSSLTGSTHQLEIRGLRQVCAGKRVWWIWKYYENILVWDYNGQCCWQQWKWHSALANNEKPRSWMLSTLLTANTKEWWKYTFDARLISFTLICKTATGFKVKPETNGFRENWGMVLTQSSRGGDFTEGSRAHFILRQDADLVVSGRRQTWHLQTGARGGGHRHREPVLLSIIITHWNLLHPAETERAREKKWEQKSGGEFWESGFMKHDRKVGSINHSYSSSAPDLCQRQHWCIHVIAERACNSNYDDFSGDFRIWGSIHLSYIEQMLDLEAKRNSIHLFKTEETFENY